LGNEVAVGQVFVMRWQLSVIVSASRTLGRLRKRIIIAQQDKRTHRTETMTDEKREPKRHLHKTNQEY